MFWSRHLHMLHMLLSDTVIVPDRDSYLGNPRSWCGGARCLIIPRRTTIFFLSTNWGKIAHCGRLVIVLLKSVAAPRVVQAGEPQSNAFRTNRAKKKRASFSTWGSACALEVHGITEASIFLTKSWSLQMNHSFSSIIVRNCILQPWVWDRTDAFK